jgi:hypothetical protein
MSDTCRLPDRFWEKVKITGGCWLWTARTRTGYGLFHWERKTVAAHRLAYEMLVAPIPEGLEIDHLCRVRRCVNPAHLEPVTCRENTLRGHTVPAANIAKTHCPQGHPYDEENTYVAKRGDRHCRKCQRARKLVYRQRAQQDGPSS